MIDGYTHPGASPNTLAVGNNAVLKVELSGEDFLGGHADRAHDHRRRHHRAGPGDQPLRGAGDPDRWRRRQRHRGQLHRHRPRPARPTSTAPPPPPATACSSRARPPTRSAASTAAARNVISGNGDDGVEILGAGSVDNVVQGNYIGTTKSGAVALGNDESGVAVERRRDRHHDRRRHGPAPQRHLRQRRGRVDRRRRHHRHASCTATASAPTPPGTRGPGQHGHRRRQLHGRRRGDRRHRPPARAT